MANGTPGKTSIDRGCTSLDHIPIGSQEIFLSSEAVMTLVHLGRKAFVARLVTTLNDVSTYEEACAGVQEMLDAILQRGRKSLEEGPFEA